MTEPLVRPMRLEDLPTVMEIDRQCLPTPWREATWREELRSPFSLYLVLVESDVVSGYIGVKVVVDELHITTIAVHPEHRRNAFARALIKAVLTDQPHARRVYLEVRPSNLAARSLYDSLDFVQKGVRSAYYGDEDALLLTLNLDAQRRSPQPKYEKD